MGVSVTLDKARIDASSMQRNTHITNFILILREISAGITRTAWSQLVLEKVAHIWRDTPSGGDLFDLKHY